MTGLAIVVYLNQTPEQPRERDYAYAGSFYAFAIWIGMGVAAISDFLNRFAGKKLAPVTATVICLLVPIQMVSQTWDDHDRSGRYTCRDFGQNYLTSLQQTGNPIIFTNGDNDTFPLWYNFETEGFRTDARCCNLSYLMTDWYIDQMKRPAYESPSLPISLDRIDYMTGVNDFVTIRAEYKQRLLRNNSKEVVDESFELKNVISYWIRQNHVIPTDTVWLKIDKDAVLRSGMKIPAKYIGATDEETKANIPDRMVISLTGKKYLTKSEIMILDMLAHSNWERPLYFATTVASGMFLNMGNYFLLEGLAYRITPFDWKSLGDDSMKYGDLDADRMYENLMNFKFGGLDNPDLYLDETVRRMCDSHRRIFAQLAMRLIKDGRREDAARIMDKLESSMSEELVPLVDCMYGGASEIADIYRVLGQKDKAKEIILNCVENYMQQMRWFLSMNNRNLRFSRDSFQMAVSVMYHNVLPVLQQCIEEDQFKIVAAEWSAMCDEFDKRLN